jgi:hypothetical protein
MSARMFLNVVYTVSTRYLNDEDHEGFDAWLESDLSPRRLEPVAGETVIVS